MGCDNGFFWEIQQNTRLPPRYFLLSNFVCDVFQKDESNIFWKKYPSNFSTFWKLKIFRFFLQNHNSGGKKSFWKKIWYEFYRFSTFTDCEKIHFFNRKTHPFFKKMPTFLRNLSLSVAFYSKFVIIWWWRDFKLKTIGNSDIFNLQVNKRKRTPWVDDFIAVFKYIKYMRKIIIKNWFWDEKMKHKNLPFAQ